MDAPDHPHDASTPRPQVTPPSPTNSGPVGPESDTLKGQANEVDVTAELVQQLLREQFPQWSSLPVRPVEAMGSVNAMFRLGQDMVVRLTRTPTDADVDYEVCWLNNLAERLPLETPEVLGVGDPGADYPWNWSILRWLEGQTWTRDAVDDPFADAERLADFINALQAVDPNSLPCKGASFPPLEAADEFVRRCATRVEGIDTRLFLNAWDEALGTPPSGPAVIAHWDLLPGNVIIHAGRLSGVIDWAATSLGEPSRDVMAAWTLLGGEERQVFRSALGTSDETWRRGRAWLLTGIVGVVLNSRRDPQKAEADRTTLMTILDDVRQDR